MDPKRHEDLLNIINKVIHAHNRMALIEYARFLKRCGVQRPTIYDTIVLPNEH